MRLERGNFIHHQLSVIRPPFPKIATDLRQLQLQAVAEPQIRVLDREKGSYGTELRDHELGYNGNRSPTPIEEERMETIKYAGSVPWNITSWFYEEHHGENAASLLHASSSAPGVPGINSGQPKQL